MLPMWIRSAWDRLLSLATWWREVQEPFDLGIPDSAPAFPEDFDCPDTQPTAPGALDTLPGDLTCTKPLPPQ